MKFTLLGRYFLDQEEDRVTWIRIFDDQLKMLAGRGVYRDDVLVLLSPTEVHEIRDLDAVRRELEFDTLPVWNKTRFLIHMGGHKQNYSVDEAMRCDSGEAVNGSELEELVNRIQQVF
ncbi:MAG TPA: hypothetical protein VMW73_02550 [Spirochaetia bacterium]|nr:hypothetical protein [Spirochaetia bacterium]